MLDPVTLQGWTEAPDLAKWVRRQRVARAQGALSEERLQVLYAMGFEFGEVAQLTEEWESKFDQLIEWLLWQVCNSECGHFTKRCRHDKSQLLPVSVHRHFTDHKALCCAVSLSGQACMMWHLQDQDAVRKGEFNWLGFDWGRRGGLQARELALWVQLQREFRRRNLLGTDAIKRLEAIGFNWEPEVSHACCLLQGRCIMLMPHVKFTHHRHSLYFFTEWPKCTSPP